MKTSLRTHILSLFLVSLLMGPEVRATICHEYLGEAQTDQKPAQVSKFIKLLATQNILFPQMHDAISMGLVAYQIQNKNLEIYPILESDIHYMAKVMESVHAKSGITFNFKIPIMFIAALQTKLLSPIPEQTRKTIDEFLTLRGYGPLLNKTKNKEQLYYDFFNDPKFAAEQKLLSKIMDVLLQTLRGPEIKEISDVYKSTLLAQPKPKNGQPNLAAVNISRVATENVEAVLESALIENFYFLITPAKSFKGTQALQLIRALWK